MSERATDISREAATWLERREREDWTGADSGALDSYEFLEHELHAPCSLTGGH